VQNAAVVIMKHSIFLCGDRIVRMVRM